IRDKAQHFGAHRAVELLRMLRERGEAVGIERPLLADLRHQLAGSAEFLRSGALEHEHEQIVRQRFSLPGEGGLCPLQLAPQRLAIGRQIGKPAAGELRHLVERFEIGSPGCTQTKAHIISPVASRWSTSAESSARSFSDGTIMNSSGEWIAPPRTPMVSTTGIPQAAMLLPSHTPPVDFQPISCPSRAPQSRTRSNSFCARRSTGLGGRVMPPWRWIATSCAC